MPPRQQLRESVTELSKGCQLEVQLALQGAPGLGSDQEHKPLWTHTVSQTDRPATPKLQETKGTHNRWGGESMIKEGFPEEKA